MVQYDMHESVPGLTVYHGICYVQNMHKLLVT